MVGRPGRTSTSNGSLPPLIVINYLYILDGMLKGKLVPALVVVIVIMTFALGAMWGKLHGLNGTVVPTNQAGSAQPVVVGKYKSFDEAIKDVAKQAGVKDTNKLLICMSSGEKKSLVDADAAEGSKAGVSGTPAFFINGRLLAGAYPFDEFKKIIDEELTSKANPKTVRTPVTLGNAPTRGSGKIILVEYSDFQCPFCARAFPTVQQVLKEYPGKVLFAYKHFPLTSIHPHAQKAAEASECARDQDKFWEFHDKLFETQSDWANL